MPKSSAELRQKAAGYMLAAANAAKREMNKTPATKTTTKTITKTTTKIITTTKKIES